MHSLLGVGCRRRRNDAPPGTSRRREQGLGARGNGEDDQPGRVSGWGMLGLAWLVALNLRTGFVGIGPVLPRLIDDLGLSSAQASVLVAVPTAMMGLAAVPGGRFADRRGAAPVITLGLTFVALGGALRAVASTFPPLLGLTIVFGAGLGIVQSALPRLVREWFAANVGSATGVYASGFVSGAFLSASLTGPVLLPLFAAGAWRPPLLVWGALALVTLLAWLAAARRWRPASDEAGRRILAREQSAPGPVRWSPWHDRRAWHVAALFASQGVAYYLAVAWLPAAYEDLGLGPGQAGALFAAFNAATLPAILVAPALSDRIKARRPPLVGASLVFGAGALGLTYAPLADGWRWLWAALAGAGVAAVFALTLVLPTDVAPAGRTGSAAGMVLGVGYAGSALGPVVGGAVRDATGSFADAMTVLPAVGLVMVALSLGAPELPRRP